ncbi:Polysaccharide ABC transporter, ATP-binding protein [Azospirillaceae bacterium]
MSKLALVVEGLGKKFGLTLRSALKYGLIDSVRRMVGRDSDPTLRSGEFWALKDVSFSLKPGDALGIMGVNGSGKTTLLRILNGTYSPDTGKVELRGRIGALIAAGAGFSPMHSGKENVYISGTLLGMTPRQIKARFDEIVAFAELGEFIDMPVRNYSSGMSVRLGFAIAVIGTPDILLVDEVLAVGDIAFQKKCFERIQEMRKQGTTILLVSHAPSAIWSICNKGLNLNHGCSIGITSVEDACRTYEDNNFRTRAQAAVAEESSKVFLPKDYGGTRGGSGGALIKQIDVLDGDGHPIEEHTYGRDFVLRCYIWTRERIDKCILRVLVDSDIHKAISIIDNYEVHHRFIDIAAGEHTIDIIIRRPCLRPGVYTFGGSLIHRDVGVHLFFEHNQAHLTIIHPKEIFFYAEHRASIQLNTEYRNASWAKEDTERPKRISYTVEPIE